jgi:hemerythrin
MEFMPWSDDYSVRVLQLDAQHKHLVGMINGLVEVMQRGAKPDELAALLEDLLDYTRYHFETEEKLMARAGYAGLADHRAKHAAMRAEVERLLAAAQTGNATTAMKLMAFLKNWLAKHINGTDKLYAPALEKAGIA